MNGINLKEGELNESLLQKRVKIITGILNLKFFFLLSAIIGLCPCSYSQNTEIINLKSLNYIKSYTMGNSRNRSCGLMNENLFLFKDETENLFLKNLNENNISKKNNSEILNYPVKYNKPGNEIPEFINVSYKAGYLREIEEFYSTNSFYQNLKVNKRFSDFIRAGISVGIDYSKREEIDLPDEKRWYDNSGLNCEINFNPYNTLILFVSGSISDTTFTSYGFSYNSMVEAGEFQINNYLTLSYDYFYFWNQVAQNYANDNFKINYRDFSISAGYFFGVVDYNYVDGYDEKAKNPNSSFNCQVQYEVSSKPLINVGINFNTRDFKYYSPLYYSPQDRKITGMNITLYNAFSDFYIYFGSGARIDNNDVFIWDIDGEFGYDIGNFSLSGGFSRYNDPYYTSYNTFINLTKSF